MVEDDEEQSPNTQVPPVNIDAPSIAALHGPAASFRIAIGTVRITIVQRQRTPDRAAVLARHQRE